MCMRYTRCWESLDIGGDSTESVFFRFSSWEILGIFISLLCFSSLSCYLTISPSQPLSRSLFCSNPYILLPHSIVHMLSHFFVCEWVLCLVNEWTGQFINIKFGCALFPVYRLVVYDMVVYVCVHCFFALDFRTSSNMTRLLFAYTLFIYEYVISKENEWKRCEILDLDQLHK